MESFKSLRMKSVSGSLIPYLSLGNPTTSLQDLSIVLDDIETLMLRYASCKDFPWIVKALNSTTVETICFDDCLPLQIHETERRDQMIASFLTGYLRDRRRTNVEFK